ncbi:MAG TPA: hypothetical protein VMS00_15080 [Acidimicrobiales bacterium]|nr:hypothetical protein [Acidimicrobiales bacterium]
MNQQQTWLHREPTRRYGPFAAAGLALLALALAACGSPKASPPVAHVARSSSTIHTSSRTNALVLATRCLRQHGLPDMPDPIVVSSGPAKGQMALDKPALAAYPSSVVNQAVDACRTALEQAGMASGANAAASSQEIRYLLAFARCVRNHGITNFPDPDSQGHLNLAGTGINSHELTPAELAAARKCLPTAHGDVNIPTQGGGTSNSGS